MKLTNFIKIGIHGLWYVRKQLHKQYQCMLVCVCLLTCGNASL